MASRGTKLLDDERLDGAAETLLKNLGVGLMFGLAPLLVTRRPALLMGSLGLGLGYAAGITTRDVQGILARPPASISHQVADAVELAVESRI